MNHQVFVRSIDGSPGPGRWVKTPLLGYWLLLLVLVLAKWLGLGTPLITALFAYFVLDRLRIVRNKALSILLFLVIVLSVFYGFGHFLRKAIVELPEIAKTSIPTIVNFCQKHGVDLPWEDADDLKGAAIDNLKSQLKPLSTLAAIASKEFAFVLIAVVVALCLFINPKLDLDKGKHPVRNNLYSLACDGIVAKFTSFYESFARVMGAQLIISVLNTGFTAVFVLIIHLPYALVVIVLTFLCGLLPIIGNLVSNSVIVALSFTVSPKMALISAIYLVVVHKLEYFLNSKIVGDRIRNPVWLTLLGLIIGERLMGIPGMILAPVVLNFIKVEASAIEVVPPEELILTESTDTPAAH